MDHTRETRMPREKEDGIDKLSKEFKAMTAASVSGQLFGAVC
jgi:hypothetical protein